MSLETRFSKEDKQRASEAGKKGGARARDLKKGIHGFCRETTRQFGLIGGPSCYKQGKGIHAFDVNQRKEASRAALASRGKTPWGWDEYAVLYELIIDNNYRIQDGTNRGMYDNVRIANHLNYILHDGLEVRTVYAVKNAIGRVLAMEAAGELTC